MMIETKTACKLIDIDSIVIPHLHPSCVSVFVLDCVVCQRGLFVDRLRPPVRVQSGDPKDAETKGGAASKQLDRIGSHWLLRHLPQRHPYRAGRAELLPRKRWQPIHGRTFLVTICMFVRFGYRRRLTRDRQRQYRCGYQPFSHLSVQLSLLPS